MFIFGEDKSAFGTLQGLVEVLNSDVSDLVKRRARLKERSQEYQQCAGKIAALNDVIGLIKVTDIWHAGMRKKGPEHYHVRAIVEDRAYKFTRREDVLAYLKKQGVDSTDAFAMLSAGYELFRCDAPDCVRDAQSAPNGQ